VDIHALRQLCVIAECGTISAAARKLHSSQPSVTQSIQRLESHLETKLLVRDPRGVTLTSSGRVLVEAAGRVFEILEQAEQSIRGLERDDVGRFTVGCHESLGAYFMPDFMRSLLETAPGIEVALWNGPSARVQRAVIDRDVDFGLVVNPEPHPDLVLVELYRDGVEAYVSVEEDLPHDLEQAKARVKRGPLIYAGRVQQCRDIIARLVAENCMPERRLECGDLEMVKSLVTVGLGVALLPRRVAQHGTRGRLVQLHPELPGYPDAIRLLYRSDLHRTKAALKLKDALVAHGRSLRESDPGVDSIVLE